MKKTIKTIQLMNKVEKINKKLEERAGCIMDADTVLLDIIQDRDFEISGIATNVFDIWKQSSDKKSVEKMFYELTRKEFDEYLELVISLNAALGINVE